MARAKERKLSATAATLASLPETLVPRMSAEEITVLSAFLAGAERYLEFGTGGSTCLAASLVSHAVTSVDSAPDWIAQVAAVCAAHPHWLTPRLHYVDIGRTIDWGKPADHTARDRWADYHARIWDDPLSANADLYMVDGRFRVACAAQIALHCRTDALVMMHDFASRPRYHVVLEFLRPIARTGDLAVFQRRRDADPNRLREILARHAQSYE